MDEITSLTASEASLLLAAGKLSAERLVAACLERIAAREPMVGAWAYLEPDRALASARALDRMPRRGPLHGIPIGIKDIIDTADLPTAYGSTLYRGHRPAWDAACVAALRAAGAVIIGKTVTSEFAAYHPGRTRNPHDPSRTTGISSMGSAAAVADFMVPLALGSQTGASIIRPAAFCGAIGYKPSFGRFSRAGMRPFADSLDTLGYITRSIDDARLLGAVLSGEPDFGQARLDRAPRLGLCRTHAWDRAERIIQENLEHASAMATAADFMVSEIELPAPFADLNEAVVSIMCFEAARAFAFEYNENRSALGAATVRFLNRAATLPAERYWAAKSLIESCMPQLAAVFETVDALITPSAECEPGPLDDPGGDSVFNRLWTGLHVPCVTLPLAAGPGGLPIGLQLIGPYRRDAHLLAVAEAVWDRLGPRSRSTDRGTSRGRA